jgi:tRNA 2-thiouridine synthesizing protein A|tara:strand:+ start:68 stop:310 length:243 start_codon:yes stop_codon:yes gene_type:complete
MKTDEIIFDKSYDFRGLKCPLPVLKARRALNNLDKGQVIKILADDPAANLDFKHFCEVSGNILVNNTEEDKNLIFFIKKI